MSSLLISEHEAAEIRRKRELAVTSGLFRGWLLVLVLAIPFLTYLTWEIGRTDRFEECIGMKHIPSECSRHTKP